MINPTPPMNLSDLEQKLPTQNSWENLEEMYKECCTIFGELRVYPESARQLEVNATETERKELQRILRNIHVDSQRYFNELNNIRQAHLDQNGQPRKRMIYDTMAGEDLFDYTSIAVSYRNWMDSFQALITQPMADFAAISDIISKRLQTPVS